MTELALSVQEAIAGALRLRPEIDEARLFGSRAKGNARPESDIDIAIFGELDEFATEAIAEELEELPLPYRFDVKAYGTIRSRELKEHIDRVGVTIYKRGLESVAEGEGNRHGGDAP